MSYRFEESVVRHCAAMLAGHKCGSLFSYKTQQGECLEAQAAQLGDALADKGVCVRLLRRCECGGLVYVYRPAALAARLAERDVRTFLSSQGYAAFSIEECLLRLSGRVRCGEAFPHEIGVFLDYPLTDVIGFIENRGCNARCVGCWKVYSNEDEARRRFALYRKCRDVYLRCYRRGFGVTRLTVAA